MDTLFFLASKLFWAVARPESWIVLLLAFAILGFRRSGERRGMAMLVSSLAFVLLVGIVPVGDALLRPLEMRFPANPQLDTPAGIIILGGAEDAQVTEATGLPGVNDAAERFFAGISLARRYPEAQLVFTGGSGQVIGQGLSDSEVAARLFQDMGIPADRVLLEGASRNTAENAAYLLDMIDDGRDGQWVLVTSAFHMPRATGTFCAAGWTGLVPFPVDYRAVGGGGLGWDFAERLRTLNIAVKEWIGLVAYRLTGRTKQMLPRGC